ncbi:MAG TPA: hypothetical protein VHT91_35905 [Kofleriaceae bacterium]|nr:hypothetical protein [Kofleriaceae bacterium]
MQVGRGCCSATTHCTTDLITRGQIAVFIGRALLTSLTLPDP